MMFGKHHFAIFGVAALLLAIAAQPLARLKAEARTLPQPATAPALAPPPDVDELARMSRYAPTVLSLGLERQVHLDTLKACPGLAPAHAAGVGRELALPDFHPLVLAAGKVRLAAAPVSAGQRRLHLLILRCAERTPAQGRRLFQQGARPGLRGW